MAKDTRVGRIVHISRGYSIAEIVDVASDSPIGFSVFGYRSDTSVVYATEAEAQTALEALAGLPR